MCVAAAALPASRDNLAAAADQICGSRPLNLRAVGVKLACSGSWAFSGKFPVFVPLQATNSNGIPGCGRLNWALSEELFIFVPFSPVFHPCLSQEKGTKFEKWPGNAHSAMPRSRKPAPKSRNRGTKNEKSLKNAQSQIRLAVRDGLSVPRRPSGRSRSNIWTLQIIIQNFYLTHRKKQYTK